MTAPLVVLAAGGTGGHMFPAEALAKALLARGIRVALLTDERGRVFGETLAGVEVHRIRSSRLPRYALDRLRAVWEMGLGALEARKLLKSLRPSVAVGFGGYPSIPTIFAASLTRIPIVLHEQNALLGRANRRMASRAQAIATSFAKVKYMPAAAHTVLTGNPVRPGILAVRDVPYAEPAATGPFQILVTGGSQGARIFSEIVPPAMALLPPELKGRLRIVQQCRPEDLDTVTAEYQAAGIAAELSTFFDDVPARLSACHLAIARSGASTVAELGVAGRPAILVPYPFAMDDHQTTNAEAYAQSGGAWVVGQRILTPKLLAERIAGLAAHPDSLSRAAEAAKQEGRPAAADSFAELVISQIGARVGQPAVSTSLKDIAV
ncbi:MAG TPA: undecaprenyldiphospho-muramoylpentapeptide beta-N-acetylglucosaminyltransferase [Alphaproteobacteria bacterium]|jgi:UDP-N-acetylglucosamine--N-acetylmuramyl-(pentapeptide) pyrophosphoryl-undecaprenol N-acetylglucosamine transferase|nr:undecaprenyldiphospho-muramoylpentapeptide beta-N-acetylglucosaminyltransferase [Alphaproteobacteria bacterium]